MAAPRRFELDDILNRPGTYFNPETEVLIVIDDAPEVDPELFEDDDGEGWVLSATSCPIDERVRDELIERFEVRHHPGTTGAVAATEDDPDELDEIEPDEDEDERGLLAGERPSRPCRSPDVRAEALAQQAEGQAAGGPGAEDQQRGERRRPVEVLDVAHRGQRGPGRQQLRDGAVEARLELVGHRAARRADAERAAA